MREDDLRYALLGPVKVYAADGRAVGLAPQQRAILAMLLARGGRAVTAGELVDGVWGAPAPERALPTLRTQIGQLRRRLEPGRPSRAPAGVLLSVSGGYRLRVADGACDLDLFQGYVAQAERAVLAGDPHGARRLFGRALDLWRGEPLAGVPGPHADMLRAALTESRLTALETRVRLDLELGAQAESIPELTLLVAEHPLREGLRAQLMLALYRGGRQGEALAAYADARRLLDEELGVEPGPELRELHRRVLNADPALGAAAYGPLRPGPVAGSGPAAGPGAATEQDPAAYHVPTPAQLPAPPADFTGRADAADRLVAALDTAAPQVVVSAVAGLGGVGKTALALHVAHRIRDRYPDGQLYVDLGGASAVPVEPAEVLARFLRALGIAAVPDGPDERAALYRSVLAGRRVLAVLDNAASARQVAPLLPGMPGCAVLVTSRARLPLPAAEAFELDVFTEDEALALLAGTVGADRVAAEPEAAAELVAACGLLPLAVRIVGARLGRRPSWSIASLADRLADTRRRMAELKAGGMAVEASFRLSYDQLSPPLARAFRLTALVEGPVFALPTAAAVLDRSDRETESLLEELVDAGLLEAVPEGGYRYHDLLRLFARARAEEAGGDDGEADRALGRLVDHALAAVRDAHRLARPGSTVPDELARTRAPGIRFAGANAGQEWVRRELDTLIAVLREAAARPGVPLAPAADLLLALDPFGEADFLWPRLNGPAAALAEAAADRGETAAEIRARYMLGGGLWQVGEGKGGLAEVNRALELSRATGDEVLLGQLLNVAGLVSERDEAGLALFLDSAAVHIRRGNLWGELETSANTASVLRALGRPAEALDRLTAALARARPLGWTVVRVYLQGSHARTLARLGRHAEAVDSFTEALTGCRRTGSGYLELLVEQGIAEAEQALGRPGRAAAHLEGALAAARRLGSERLQADALLGLGRALALAGHAERAQACLRAARDLRERLGVEPPEQDG